FSFCIGKARVRQVRSYGIPTTSSCQVGVTRRSNVSDHRFAPGGIRSSDPADVCPAMMLIREPCLPLSYYRAFTLLATGTVALPNARRFWVQFSQNWGSATDRA